MLSTEVVLLRGKIEAMCDEFRGQFAGLTGNMRELLDQGRLLQQLAKRQDTLLFKLLNDNAAVNASLREEIRRELAQYCCGYERKLPCDTRKLRKTILARPGGP